VVTPDGRQSVVAAAVYTITTAAGFRDQSYGTVSAPTATDAESPLWFAHGVWWGALYQPTGEPKGFHIARLDPATQRWSDAGVLIDARRGAKLDALRDGDRLYLASHLQQPDPQGMSGRRAAAASVELRRYRYDPITRSYQLEFGPVAVAPGDMEAFVLVQDTTGVLWGAFTQDNQVQVVHTQREIEGSELLDVGGGDLFRGVGVALDIALRAVTEPSLQLVGIRTSRLREVEGEGVTQIMGS
jgi:hypothetical protein